MAKCKKCQNIYNLSNKDDVIVGKWCPKINDSPNIERERECKHFKAMSNADKIRSMSDEELADMLHNIGSYVENGEPFIDIYIGENKSTIDDSFGFILDWLQSEAE